MIIYTDSYGEYHDVCDVDERPDDADDRQTAGGDDVHVDESVFEIVAEERRHDVRHALGHTEQSQRHRTLSQLEVLQFHVVALSFVTDIVINSSARRIYTVSFSRLYQSRERRQFLPVRTRCS